MGRVASRDPQIDDSVPFSYRWLEHFKARHGITFMHVGGEPNSVSVDVITEWQTNKLPALLARHDEKGVFNANESGLFQKAKRNRTYTVSGSQCHDGNHSKKRLC